MLVVLGLALAAASSPNASAEVGLKAYALGSSLETFKSQTLPDGKYGPTRVMCSDMPDAKSWLATSLPQSVVCSFEQQIGGSWVRDSLALSADVSATVDFHFFEGRLAMIETYVDAVNANVVGESLATRFGKAARVETAPFQVRSGATFPQTVTTWAIGSKAIVMKAPDLSINRMSVFYLDEPAVAKARALRKPADIM